MHKENSDCLFDNEDELKHFANSLKIRFFFLNTNFDGSNIQKPLSAFFDLSLTMGLGYYWKQKTTIDLEENVAILEDSYYGLQPDPSQQLKFY